jgi:hypothetical protein
MDPKTEDSPPVRVTRRSDCLTLGIDKSLVCTGCTHHRDACLSKGKDPPSSVRRSRGTCEQPWTAEFGAKRGKESHYERVLDALGLSVDYEADSDEDLSATNDKNDESRGASLSGNDDGSTANQSDAAGAQPVSPENSSSEAEATQQVLQNSPYEKKPYTYQHSTQTVRGYEADVRNDCVVLSKQEYQKLLEKASRYDALEKALTQKNQAVNRQVEFILGAIATQVPSASHYQLESAVALVRLALVAQAGLLDRKTTMRITSMMTSIFLSMSSLLPPRYRAKKSRTRTGLRIPIFGKVLCSWPQGSRSGKASMNK